MHKIYTAAGAEQTDDYTIKNIGIPSLVLMERAAEGVTKRVLEVIKEDNKRPVICVCGKGNNGADGLAVARQLAQQSVNVSVYLCNTLKKSAGDSDNIKSDFDIQLNICLNIGLKFLKSLRIPAGAVVVDSVFGNGLDREVGGIYKDVIAKINKSGAYVIATDIPSGINATTGRVMGSAVRADETVTFGTERTGHILYPGAEYTGRLTVENIGWQTAGLKEIGISYYLLDEDDLKLIPGRKANSHKGSFGSALLISGSKEYGGAPILCAGAAFASGAGLVRVYTHKKNRAPLLSRLPEAIVSSYGMIGFEPEKLKESKDELKRLIKNADATAAGPGLGKSKAAAEILKCVFENVTSTLILDADALNLIADGRVTVPTGKGTGLIITPHLKEAARLLGCDVEEVEADLTGTALKLHKKFNAGVILKSAVTVITDGKEIFINKGGNSGMACAGSGDVLTGLLCGLAAQGLKGAELMCAGVYLHSAAGECAKRKLGEAGMLPSDIAKSVRDVLKSTR